MRKVRSVAGKSKHRLAPMPVPGKQANCGNIVMRNRVFVSEPCLKINWAKEAALQKASLV